MYILQQELFTSQNEIKNHLQRTNKFKEATIAGWKYALENQDEIIDIIYEKYSKDISKDSLKNEAKEIEKLILPYTYKIGSIDKNFLSKQLELFKDDFNIGAGVSLNDFIFIDKEKKNFLTQEEKNYIKENPTISFSGNQNWLPFEAFDDVGNHIGIVADYLVYIENELKINFIKKVSNNLENTKLMEMNEEVDIISGEYTDAILNKNFKPIDSYIKSPIVIVMQDDYGFVNNLSEIQDMKIAVLKNCAYKEELYKIYPDIKFIEVNSIDDGLLGVKDAKFDAMLSSLLVAEYTILNKPILDIKIVGKTEIVANVTLFVNKNKPLLHSIINKTIKNKSEILHRLIISKWKNKNFKTIIDYSLFLKALIVFLLILMVVLYFLNKQRELNKRIEDLNQTLEDKVKEEVQKNRDKDKQLLQQSRLAQMGEMISMIAHQWRQPLAAISSTSTSLEIKANLNKLDKDMVIQQARNISKYSQHLSATIDDFRDFFKPDKVQENISFDEVISSALNIVESSIENKNIKIVQKLESKERFDTYSNELKQVVLNLIKNAEDILVEKDIQNPTITIITKGNELAVSDNAGGIKEDILDKVFDPYFSTKSDKNGTGLGLYMSKIIIEEHCGGELSVQNDKDGAVFKISL